MNASFSIFKLRFYNLLFLVLIVLFYPNLARGSECVYARDTGTIFRVVVPAKPDLTIDNKYNPMASSQRAAWLDTKLYTSGDPFYFEIEGMWSPWSATFDLIGGDKDNRDSYAGLQTKPPNALFCGITTKNKGVEKFNVNGEFDYISSIMDVSGTSHPYSVMMRPHYIQNTCWLTAGEGLYIGFFGKNGDSLPSLATHLKTADILCDAKYLLDKNNDGVLTTNECIRSNRCYKGDSCTENDFADNTSMLYYTIGAVRCDSEFHQKTPGLPIGAIGINDCYQDITLATGPFRVNKTLFIFDAGFLYKNPQKEKVRRNERIKFVIYDRYYSDNVGQYVINMYGGITDNSDKGLIEKIIGDLEKLFMGSRDESGILTGGYLTTFYNYLIVDSNFNFIVRVSLILYMTFLGFSFALGSLEYKTKELMNILLKLTFAIAFTTTTSWEIYDKYIIRFFYDGFSSIVSMLGNISLLISDDTATVSTGVSMASKFSFIDNIIISLFSNSITRKILGLFFGVWYGFIAIPIIYILIIYYIFQLINAIFPYVVMFIQVILGLFVGPIFIVFSLFKTTEFMFKGWLNFIGGRFANMMFLFFGIFVFWMIIQAQFNSLLFFNSCKVPLWQAMTGGDSANTAMKFFSLGISVWRANWDGLPAGYSTPSFFSFCLSLLFLYVLIYLFGIVMKKIPTIVDGIFAINDERAGGGLDRSGESRLGAKIGGFFENVNKSLTVGSLEKDEKTGNYKEVRRGVFDYFGNRTRKYMPTVLKNTGRAVLTVSGGKLLWNKTVKKGYNAARYGLDKFFIKDDLKEKGLKGQPAIDNAVERYKEKLRERGFSQYDIEERSMKFRDDMTRHFFRDAREAVSTEYNRLSSLHDDAARRTGITPSDSERAQTIKGHLDSFVKSEFNKGFDGKTGYYSTSMQLKLSSSAGDSALSKAQAARFNREFSLLEKSSRYGRNFANFEEYSEFLKTRIEELRTANDPAWKMLANEKYWATVEEAGRLKVELEEKARLAKESSEEVAKSKEVLEERREADRKQHESEKAQLETDKARLEEERAKIAKSEKELAELRNKDGATEQEIKAKENELESMREKAKVLQGNIESQERLVRLEEQLKVDKENAIQLKKELDELERRGASQADIKGKEDKLKEAEKKAKEDEERLAQDTRFVELRQEFKAEEERQPKLKKELKKQEEEFARIMQELKTLKKEPTPDRSKIVAKEKELKPVEAKIIKLREELAKLAQQSQEKLTDARQKLEVEAERIDRLKSKISEMKSSLDRGSLDPNLERDIRREEYKLRLIEDSFVELKVQLLEQAHENLIREGMGLERQLGDVITIAERTDKDVEQYKQTNKDENFALQGINTATFGVQGITTIGLGEDNKDPLGFGKGAGAALINDSFNPQGTEISKAEEDNYRQLYEENRIKMEKQEVKMLKYKMTSATDTERSALEQQVQAKERDIRLREDRLK